MRTEAKLFTILVIFFLIVTPLYWFLSHDVTGSVALAVTFLLSSLIAYYLWFISSKIGDRPEDRGDAEIYEGAGEIGFFSPHSIWPLCVAASGAIVFVGLAIGWWLVIIGAPLLAISAIGWVFEYYRGDFAH